MTSGFRRACALVTVILLPFCPLAPARGDAATQSVYWRVVGHASEGDREFHFVVTFAQLTVPQRPVAHDVYVAGLEITSDDPHAFVQEQRLDRPGLGDAALRPAPLDLHVDGWTLHTNPAHRALRLSVPGDRGSLALSLRGDPAPLPVLAGTARSAPLAAIGTLTIDGRSHAVHGIATIERITGGDIDTPQADWSWFDVHLDDGRSFFVDERRDGADRLAALAGAMQAADGRVTPLLPSALVASEWGRCSWLSPSTGARYPTVWDLTLRGENLVLQSTMREQEVVPSIGGPAFWEGAADVIDAATDARIGWATVTMRGIGSHPLPCGG